MTWAVVEHAGASRFAEQAVRSPANRLARAVDARVVVEARLASEALHTVDAGFRLEARAVHRRPEAIHVLGPDDAADPQAFLRVATAMTHLVARDGGDAHHLVQDICVVGRHADDESGYRVRRLELRIFDRSGIGDVEDAFASRQRNGSDECDDESNVRSHERSLVSGQKDVRMDTDNDLYGGIW